MKTRSTYVVAASAVFAIGLFGAIMISSTGVAQDVPATQEAAANGDTIEGRVTDVVDVPGYTYVEVVAQDGSVWAAAPSVEVQVGETVSFSKGMPMTDFFSKTLNREFETLYFVDRFQVGDRVTSIDHEAAAPHGQVGIQASKPVSDIGKASGGYTIEEIFESAADLDGESVRVRGQVVKFTPRVMNTNWIRIRDGSIESDLIIPTDTTVAIGDILLVEGTLVVNMDLGQGYVLPAVLQNAGITIE